MYDFSFFPLIIFFSAYFNSLSGHVKKKSAALKYMALEIKKLWTFLPIISLYKIHNKLRIKTDINFYD